MAMGSIWRMRVILALAVLLAAAVLDGGRPAAQRAPAVRGSLAGQLLVASPEMGDPRFARTVIVMVRHGNDGAFGLVINRLVGERPLSDLLEMLGDKDATVTGTVNIFWGGPVELQRGFVLHSSDYRGPGTVEIDGQLGMSTNREIVREIASGKGPAKSMVVFGYSGWGPGQLEGEMARRSWTVAPAEPGLVFDEDRAKVWDKASALRSQDL